MSSDQLDTASHMLRSSMELQLHRSQRALSELEKLESDQAEYVIENFSQLHHQLIHQGVSAKQARRIYQSETMKQASQSGVRDTLWYRVSGPNNVRQPKGGLP